MTEFNKQLEYIKNQLIWVKSKVELDNQLGLYDINKLGEDIFMHILNDVYDLNLKNANNMLHDDFPSIDLVDEVNKKVIQVTSTVTLKKARGTVQKLKDLKSHEITGETSNSLKNSISFFRELKNYEEYELSIFYIKEKPNITKNWTEFLDEEGLSEDNILGIDDIVNIVQADPNKCEILYKTIQQRMDSISFKFNIDSYFESFEPHLVKNTSNKFKKYESSFTDFIQSHNKIFEIYAVGGSGKSHLLKYFASIETEYIPLIFTKQINIEEDLKKLDFSKKYLFIFDDIDRFLDTPILMNLLSYSLSNDNIKCMISYRTASKNTIETIFRKYSHINKQELEIIWDSNECHEMIKSLASNLEEQKIIKIAHQFNNNPYLITQALYGNIDNIKDFSKKMVDDTQIALKDFSLNDKKIFDLLFELSLLSPISKNNISKDYQVIIDRLVDKKILRELVSKYRFNPDILGDLYLANYIDENKDNFEIIVEKNLKNFSDTVFTNLSYALVYNDSDSLQNFIKSIINRWIEKQEYGNYYLALINKVVYYAPLQSFIYLEKATKELEYKKTGHHSIAGESLPFVGTFAPPNGDWTSDSDAINLESIEPIISKLIYVLKNDIPSEELDIEHIIKYLTSKKVLSLPKPYYDNQTLESIFEKLVSPLDTKNFDVILKTLEIMERWLYEKPINNLKIYLLKKTVESLLRATFGTTDYEGGTFTLKHTLLNLKYQKVKEIIFNAKKILLNMLESDNLDILYLSLDMIPSIGGHYLNELPKEHQEFYYNIKKEVLLKCIEVLERETTFSIVAKIESLSINILRFSPIKDEALNVLGQINRSNEYLFYQIINNDNVLILNYDNFYNECIKQEDIKEWIYQNEIQKINSEKPSKIEWEIIDAISDNYKEYSQYLQLLNSLSMSAWDSTQILMSILRKWLSLDNQAFIDLALNHFNEINNNLVANVLKEAILLEGKKEVHIDDISETLTEDEIRIYINSLFKNYTDKSIDILNKIIEVSKNKKPEYINWIISIISRNLYFKIREDISLYKEFEHIIIQFLDWQLQYNLNIENYITHHILHDTILNEDISDEVKDRLKKIVKKDEIFIREYELKPIYKILNFRLEECIDILYNKLTSLKDDKTPKHIFTHYFDNDNISEVLLLKDFINSYDDFKFLVNKVLELYKKPVKFIGADGNNYEAYINLDYFFKYTVKEEYLNEFFNKLYESNKIDTIKILYKIVPVNSTYLEIIVKNLNILEDKIDDKDLMNYLRQVGKIKSFSRSFGENSNLLLNEEALFKEIYKRVNSLPLQLKLKEELKNLEIQKREEREEDISYLLDK